MKTLKKKNLEEFGDIIKGISGGKLLVIIISMLIKIVMFIRECMKVMDMESVNGRYLDFAMLYDLIVDFKKRDEHLIFLKVDKMILNESFFLLGE